MIEDPQQLEKLLHLPPEERLRLARLLIDSARQDGAEAVLTGDRDQQTDSANPLLELAGRYSGGPGNTAECAEDILESEADAAEGLSVR
jgi:hypothetical protein